MGLYSGPAERKKDPRPIKRPTVVETEADPTFVDTCNVDFTAKPTKQRQVTTSQQLTVQGNASLQTAGTTGARPTSPPAVQAAQAAIEKYREALIKDPYNAQATLKLALAYDRVLRKGCALAMLRRLDGLASNQTFEAEAVPMVDLIQQNPHWFKPYHGDALKAAGR